MGSDAETRDGTRPNAPGRAGAAGAPAGGDATFRSLAELAPDAVFINRGGHVAYINPAGLALWRATDSAQLLGRPVLDLFHPSSHALILSRIDAMTAREGDVPWVGETLVALDGTTIDAEVTARSFHIGDELVVLVVCRDVTERNSARIATSRMAAIVESSDDAMFSQDRSGLITSWNHGAERLFGYSAVEILGTSIVRMVPADQRDGIAAVRARVLTGNAVRLSAQRLTKDGRIVDVSVSLSPIRAADGEVIGIATVARDMTEQRRAERALRENEERLRDVAENIRDVIWMTDPEKRAILFISPAYEKIWGRSCESLLSDPRGWLAAIHHEDRDRVIDAAMTKQATGTYNETYRILRPDGEVRWIHDRAYPVRETTGAVARIVGIAEDVTEQRKLEEQLRQAQKMEAVGQLAGGVAHDFNNILAAITLQADLALAGANVDADTRDLIGEIRVAADRAAHLTRQLLAFSRRQVLVPELIEINESVRNVARLLLRVLGEDVTLELALHAKELRLRADPGMLDQVILNLAVNSRDAMPQGGRLRIEVAERTIADEEADRTPGCPAGRYVELVVSDTGLGIAPDVLPRIFEPFFTTKAVDKGTGLGLATVFGIVNQHGGWIGVASELGAGTTFRILLPAVEAGAAPRAPAPIAAPAHGNETILIVEDDSALQMALARLLEHAGYVVLKAADGPEAIALWQAHRDSVMLVYTDLVLPGGVTGRELASRFRTDKPSLPVIFSSGYSRDVAGREFELDAQSEFLPKPSTPSTILSAIRRRLDT